MDRGAWWVTVHGGHKKSDTTEATLHIQHRPCLCLLLLFQPQFHPLYKTKGVDRINIYGRVTQGSHTYRSSGDLWCNFTSD